ncbi:hypothetical protein KVV02_000703 [Mortierella alpina]|uniref:C3H1-type domain-containing protein n=1 Tax=Mortierella alpina TaxID=64518 RepID=A0A9P8A1L1_MORAP|nr:hypothetical protein KVV02_000703 [Mortierella alpina]
MFSNPLPGLTLLKASSELFIPSSYRTKASLMTLSSESQMLRSQHSWTQRLFRVDTADNFGAESAFGVKPINVHWRPHTLISSTVPASKECRKSNSDSSRPQSESHRRMGDHSSGNWSPPPNYKTEFCMKFQEFGYCSFEDRCQFVHHPHELQRRSRALTYKTQPCWSGANCPYQKNHTRCIYLHCDETAEMFDQQRGISFAKVQKIMAKKETKQLRQQQQQQQPHDVVPTQARPATPARAPSPAIKAGDVGVTPLQGGNAMDIPPVRQIENFPWSGLWARSQDSGTESSSFSSFSSISSFLSASSDASFSSTTLTSDKSCRSLKPLIIPSTLYGVLLPAAPTKESNTVVSTAATMPELFSPGVMPVFEIPFPSHEQIDEWKDPCFMNEDLAAVSRTGRAPKILLDPQPTPHIRTTPKLPSAANISSDPLKTKKTSAVRQCTSSSSLFTLALKWSAGEDRERCSSKSGCFYELW